MLLSLSSVFTLREGELPRDGTGHIAKTEKSPFNPRMPSCRSIFATSGRLTNQYVTKRKIVRSTATEDVPKTIGWLLERSEIKIQLLYGVTLPLREVRANAYGEFTPNSCRLESLSCSLAPAVIDMTETRIQSPAWKFSRQES